MSTEAFLRSLSDQRRAFADARRVYARRLAPDFNVFDFVTPGELRLSGILAWFQDPGASHGQGALFLAEFLHQVGLDWARDGLDAARVDVEAPTYEARRIDVVVRMPGATLGIENKPFAADKPGQATDYLAWLDMQAPDGRLCLVYVSGAVGATPGEASISSADRVRREDAGQLKTISYPELLPWLTRARRACEAPDVSSFLASFVRYVEATFMGIKDMTERDAIVRTATSTGEHLRSALEVIGAAAAIRSALLTALSDQLASGLQGGLEVCRCVLDAKKYGGVSVSLPCLPGLTFRVQFEAGSAQAGDLHWLIYGVHAASVTNGSDVKARLDAKFGPAVVASDVWPWYRRASPTERHFPVEGDWRSPAPWLDVRDGTMATKIIKAAEAFHAVLQASKPGRPQYPYWCAASLGVRGAAV